MADGSLGRARSSTTLSRRDALSVLGTLSVAGAAGVGTAELGAAQPSDSPFSMFQADAGTTGYLQAGDGPSENLTTRWSAIARSNFHVLVTPVVADGTLFIGGVNGYVYAFDALTGERSWAVDTESHITSGFAYADGKLFALTSDDILAFEAGSGDLAWERSARNQDDRLYHRLAVTDGTVVVPDVWQTRALDVTNGDTIWEYDTGVPGSTIAIRDGRMVYTNPDAGRAHSVDLDTLEEEWVQLLDSQVSWNSSPTIGTDAVYFTTEDGGVHALDLSNGDERWQVQLNAAVNGSAALAGDSLIVSTGFSSEEDVGSVYSLDTGDGSTRWRYDHGAQLSASPIVASETVYAGGGGDSSSGNVVALDLTDGTVRSRIDVGFNNASFALWNGLLFVPIINGVVYALEDGDESDDETPERTAVQQEDSTPSSQASDRSTSRSQPATDNEPRNRGFFSNSGDEPDFLQNVFNLTVVGFLLSVGGIIHQMVRE